MAVSSWQHIFKEKFLASSEPVEKNTDRGEEFEPSSKGRWTINNSLTAPKTLLWESDARG